MQHHHQQQQQKQHQQLQQATGNNGAQNQQQFLQFVVKQERPELRQRIYEMLQQKNLTQQEKVDNIARLIKESNAPAMPNGEGGAGGDGRDGAPLS